MIYLRIVGDEVLAYGDKITIRNELGLSEVQPLPDGIRQVSEEEWKLARYSAHVESGNIVLGTALKSYKVTKLNEINTAYQQAIADLTPTYPDDERLTFDKQEAEARAWLADNSTPTPFVDALAVGRQMNKAELVNRIIAKADAFAIASGLLTGQRQRYEDLLDAAKTTAEVAAIIPKYSLPGVER